MFSNKFGWKMIVSSFRNVKNYIIFIITYESHKTGFSYAACYPIGYFFLEIGKCPPNWHLNPAIKLMYFLLNLIEDELY